MKRNDSLKLSQIERRLEKLRKVAREADVKPSWVQYMRAALGMTQRQLAKRANLSPPTLAQIEKREGAGKVEIETLRKLAHAMDCEFVYAFVPHEKVTSILQRRAREKAETLLRNADVHMALEDQRVEVSWEERVQRLAEKLIAKDDVW